MMMMMMMVIYTTISSSPRHRRGRSSVCGPGGMGRDAAAAMHTATKRRLRRLLLCDALTHRSPDTNTRTVQNIMIYTHNPTTGQQQQQQQQYKSSIASSRR